MKVLTTVDCPQGGDHRDDLWDHPEEVCTKIAIIVGNFLHFWSLARHKTKFQISCETCKTARLEEFPVFSVIFKFLARKCR